jgi:hypothetical protein
MTFYQYLATNALSPYAILFGKVVEHDYHTVA